MQIIERLKRLEDILLRNNEPCKAEPEPKWTPKVGEWGKNQHTQKLALITDNINGAVVTVDNQNGGVYDEMVCNLYKPTDKEVEDYMVGLAKEKYPVGTKFKSVVSEDEYVSTDYFYFHKNYLFANNGAIWYNGKWAEIVNPVRWRAEKGGKYWLILTNMQVFMESDHFLPSDDDHYNSGNYFKRKLQAKEMAVLMQFTLNNPELVKQLMTKKE